MGLGYFAHETKAPGVPVWTVSIPPLAWTGEGFTWGFRGLVFRGLGGFRVPLGCYKVQDDRAER